MLRVSCACKSFYAIVILLLCALALAEPPPYGPQDAAAYDAGKYGSYPKISFKTTKFMSPRFLLRFWAPSCYEEEEYFYFIAPHSGKVETAQGPMIVDSHGHLVWYRDYPMRTFGLMVQKYKGNDYLTWWTGDDQVDGHGHGFGSYYMFDNTYMPFQKLGAYNDQPADLHDFHISKENTVLITSYPRTKFDLTMYGKNEGYIWDSSFQEFDFETNKLLFEWRASDHFNTHCSYQEVDKFGSGKRPWDFFHINSVDKDPEGNYLISARHCAISKIHGKTGEVLWRLGGKNNSFKDHSHSGGRALDFHWQHHARWTDDYTAITLFDNQVRHVGPGTRPSRGLKIGLDQRRMTITSVKEFIHPENFTGEVMGSFQAVDNGNYLVGYGRAAAATEFSPNGSVVCDLGYGPLRRNKAGNYAGSISHSYRSFKLRWKATPYYDPEVFLDRVNHKFYVSWNGATEVRSWALAASKLPGQWHPIQKIRKSGFESSFTVRIGSWENFRLSAYDSNQTIIRSWQVGKKGWIQVEAFPGNPELQKPETSHSKSSYSRTGQSTSNLPWLFFTGATVILIIAAGIFSRTFLMSLLWRLRAAQQTPEADTHSEDESLLSDSSDTMQEHSVSNTYLDDRIKPLMDDD